MWIVENTWAFLYRGVWHSQTVGGTPVAGCADLAATPVFDVGEASQPEGNQQADRRPAARKTGRAQAGAAISEKQAEKKGTGGGRLVSGPCRARFPLVLFCLCECLPLPAPEELFVHPPHPSVFYSFHHPAFCVVYLLALGMAWPPICALRVFVFFECVYF